MEKLKKFFINLMIIAYAVIAVAVTVLLLSYNDYHCSVLGGYTFVLATDDDLEEYGYEQGSLLLVKETKPKKINAGDGIFFYKGISASEFEINYAEVLLKDDSKGEYYASYIIEGGTVIEHKFVIGSTEDLKVIPHLGTILSILESRYGYLFLIVVVSFIAFLYEIYELIMEIKYGEREEDEEDYDEDEYDEDEYDEDEYDDEYEEEEEVVVVKPKKTAKKATVAKTTTAKKVATTKRAEPKTTTKTATTKKATTKTAAKSGAATKSTSKKTSTAAKKTSTAAKASSSTTAKKPTAKSTSTKKTATAKKA